jgi:hypothetical protein
MLPEVSPDIDMVLHMALSRRTAALPRRTGRTADEILGYDERSLPR